MSVKGVVSYMANSCAKLARRMGDTLGQAFSIRAYLNYRLGKKRYQERHYEGAKRHFLAVLRADPRHFMTNVYLGRIYVKLENFAEASKRYSVAQEVDPVSYRKLDLIKEHVEALKLGANLGMLRDALQNVEKCGYLLTDLGQKIQDSVQKQERERQERPPPGKGRSRGKGTGREASRGRAPAARVYPVKSDFVSFEEYKKFTKMPPISEEELRDVDWDELLKDD